MRDGFAYGLDEGILSCIDDRHRRKKWKRGKYGHGQVLLVDDLLLVQSEEGDVALVEANPKAFRELARFTAVTGKAGIRRRSGGRKLLVRSDRKRPATSCPPLRPESRLAPAVSKP